MLVWNPGTLHFKEALQLSGLSPGPYGGCFKLFPNLWHRLGREKKGRVEEEFISRRKETLIFLETSKLEKKYACVSGEREYNLRAMVSFHSSLGSLPGLCISGICALSNSANLSR